MGLWAPSQFLDLSELRCLQPTLNRFRQVASSSCLDADGHMSDPSSGDVLFAQEKLVVNLKTAGIQALWFEKHSELIAAMHRSEKVRTAVHHRQRNLGPPLPVAAAWEHGLRGSALAFQAFLPGFMAPAQQLMEMHHAGGVGVAEANDTAQLQPGGRHHQGRSHH